MKKIIYFFGIVFLALLAFEFFNGSSESICYGLDDNTISRVQMDATDDATTFKTFALIKQILVMLIPFSIGAAIAVINSRK